MAARIDGRIHGVVLAGGLGRRMGRDKAGIVLGGRTLLSRTCERLAPQCATLAVSRHDLSSGGACDDYPIIADDLEGRVGPLAGVIAALDWMADRYPEATHLVTAAVDMPLLPMDFVSRLLAAGLDQDSGLACAASGQRVHPVAALWPVGIANALRDAVAKEDIRRMLTIVERYGFATVRWPTVPHDPFLNLNTPDDLARAESIVAAIEVGAGPSAQ